MNIVEVNVRKELERLRWGVVARTWAPHKTHRRARVETHTTDGWSWDRASRRTRGEPRRAAALAWRILERESG